MESDFRFESNELPESYLIEVSDDIDVVRFYKDLDFENKNQDVLKETYRRIEEGTAKSNSEKTAKLQEEKNRDIFTSYNIESANIPLNVLISTLHVLKYIQVMNESFSNDILLSEEYINHAIKEDLDTLLIELEVVTKEELGEAVLPLTVLLFRRIYFNELEDIGGRT